VSLNIHLNTHYDSVKFDEVCPTRRSVDIRRHSLELISRITKTLTSCSENYFLEVMLYQSHESHNLSSFFLRNTSFGILTVDYRVK